MDKAVSYCDKALSIKPDYPEVYNNRGNTLLELCKLQEAIDSYKRALSYKPGFALAHSNLLVAEQYRSTNDAETLYNLHCEWDERHGRIFSKSWPKYQNSPVPERRLRIGFISQDLRRHPVGYFTIGMLESLDKQDFQTFVYTDHPGDDLTERIKMATDKWQYVWGISDEDLTKIILDHSIHR